MSKAIYLEESQVVQARKLTWKCAFFSLLSSLILILVIIVAIWTFPIVIGDVRTAPDKIPVNIVSRSEWGAKDPTKTLESFTTSVGMFIISNTLTAKCNTTEECSKIVRRVQEVQMNMGQFRFDDIGYNFLIGGDGNVYEGRGWNIIGTHTISYNRMSYGIAYTSISNFISSQKNYSNRKIL